VGGIVAWTARYEPRGESELAPLVRRIEGAEALGTALQAKAGVLVLRLLCGEHAAKARAVPGGLSLELHAARARTRHVHGHSGHGAERDQILEVVVESARAPVVACIRRRAQGHLGRAALLGLQRRIGGRAGEGRSVQVEERGSAETLSVRGGHASPGKIESIRSTAGVAGAELVILVAA